MIIIIPLVFDSYRTIDLTHSLHEEIPTWNGSCGWTEELKRDYPSGMRIYRIKCHAGVGTHLDAPAHFIEGLATVGNIPLNRLIVPAVVLDVRSEMFPNFLVEPRHIFEFERKWGPIPSNCLLIANTGWDQFWQDPEKYRNPDEKGEMHFPGFSEAVVDYLLKKKVVGLGIDTLSPDGSNKGFPVHEKMLAAGCYLLENLTNLSELPAVGSFVISLPLKSEKGVESPIRAVGLY